MQTIQIKGYSAPADDDSASNESQAENNKPVAYKISPLVWMVVFLGLGYLGVRMVLE